MNNSTYLFEFPEILVSPRPFSVFSSRTNCHYDADIAVSDSELLKTGQCADSRAADMVDIAAAVSAADRLAICKNDLPNHIRVTLPVRNTDFLNDFTTKKLLRKVLNWYTGDEWHFKFTARDSHHRESEVQQCLKLDGPYQRKEVALWSGGLDSSSGLYSRLLEDSEKRVTLFGTGSSKIIHNNQKEVALAFDNVEAFRGRVKLIRLPVEITRTIDRPKNPSLRARGFVFLLLGAVCAYLEGQSELYVYENGVGAINLPFRASEVGLDHARSVHPISLSVMAEAVSTMLGVRFTFRNPFLFSTKAEMCGAIDKSKHLQMMLHTISCDRLRRERRMQCGICSSCLLRRQAIAVQGIDDHSCYSATSLRVSEGQRSGIGSRHFEAMMHQVGALESLLSSPFPWSALSRQFYGLADIVDRTAEKEGLTAEIIREKLMGLYSRYVREWHEVRPYFWAA